LKRLSRVGAFAVGAVLFVGCSAGNSLVPSAQTTEPNQTLQSAFMQHPVMSFESELASGVVARSCGAVALGEARCHAVIRRDSGIGHSPQGRNGLSANATPAGYGPATLQAAYGTASAAATGGAGRIVAIIDAYDDPNLESDLGIYRSQYGLPSCTTANGCFKKVNQSGGSSYPKTNASWGQETSLDVDMVSANCPNCRILVVETNSASFANLTTGVNTAARLGASAISNSYGGSESTSDATYASSYNHPGIAVTASSGDSGYGAQSPAAYGTVIAVGGTSLNASADAETVWSGAGSGCSAYESKPSWQHDAGCAKRTIADVAYDADPNTGVAVYDSFAYRGQSGWLVFGGTSVASPAIAAIYTLAGDALGTTYPASFTYAKAPSGLYDVTSGSNGSCGGTYLCTGEVGYDGPTGLGTPRGIGAF